MREARLNVHKKRPGVPAGARGPAFAMGLALALLAWPLLAGHVAGEEPGALPRYGAGAIQVRLYTDYFCGPCRSIEPAAEALLRDLVKKKRITLTLVDLPLTRHSVLYARYFLYALKELNELEHALKVRRLLFDTAATREKSSPERIETALRNKGIAFASFDPRPLFDRYNELIKEDNVHSTPTCVIVKGGKKETFIGTDEVIKGLKGLS
ncbi:MAG: thioredoxin domain-containing protein [Pseudomonadota bacterium]|nr:thioredoxin domain-containing protein [Pseudomonadota bacterium]